MKFKITLLCIGFLALASLVSAKTFTRCSLAKEMYKLGVPKSELAMWTCIAQHESSYRTNAVGPKNSNGSTDYGIFQINNKYWCKSSSIASSNSCNVDCSRLLTDDIKASVTCARKIKNQQGWKAWSTYSKCSGSLPSINSCF